MIKKIYENESIEVGTTGRDYDQIGYIKNKTNNKIRIEFGEVPGYIDEDGNECEIAPEPIKIEPHDTFGLLADFNGWLAIAAITTGKYSIKTINPDPSWDNDNPVHINIERLTDIVNKIINPEYETTTLWYGDIIAIEAMRRGDRLKYWLQPDSRYGGRDGAGRWNRC